MTAPNAKIDLARFDRSHLKEVLIDCRKDMRDPGLGQTLRAAEQYDELLAAGRTLFFLSHNEKDLRRFCTRGLYLDKGKLAMDAPIADVLDLMPLFDNSFDVDPMNSRSMAPATS